MPPSQLKRLKASLREQGIVGPQKSKKQKKQSAQNGAANKDKRVQRTVALTEIREQFNPFEFKMPAKGPKFEVTSNKTVNGRGSKVISRPGLAKSRSEESRKALIAEIQRRNKVGGILDRRFGENDPTMAPEDKMLERFTQENQRRHRSSAFDLEDDEEPGQLTHMGQSLSLDGPRIVDDFDEEDLGLSDAEDHSSDGERQRRKRRRSAEEDGEEEDDDDEEGHPERKKSKQEVMKELIAKSKLHKYERQAAKDEDLEETERLNKETQNMLALLGGMAPKAQAPAADLGGMNPERATILTGMDRATFEKEYDLRLRQLAQDKKAKPTERTKTVEEKVEEEARRLQELEAARLRRMQGQAEDSDDEAKQENHPEADGDVVEDFGFGAGIKTRPTNSEFGVEDEDDFLIDDHLIASGSDTEPSEDQSSDEKEDGDEAEDEDTEFLQGLLTEDEATRPEFLTGANAPFPEVTLPASNGVSGDLAYTFSCPQTHEELLQVTQNIAVLDLPTVVQRIRALYHPKLPPQNKSKLGNFAAALTDHVSYLANQTERPPFSVLETLIRHIHSMAKTYPVEISNNYRRHLEDIHKSRASALIAGDLVLLTAIGTIFPTSDHFHQVVTPTILTMVRYLGLKIPQTLSDFATGAYLCTLCLQYQKLSKRYVPEVMNFIYNTLCVLAPTKLSNLPGNFPYHEPKQSVRIEKFSEPRRLAFYDCVARDLAEAEEAALKLALLETNLNLLEAAADLWTGTAAFTEVFSPALKIVQHLYSPKTRTKLPSSTQKHLTKLTSKLERLLTRACLTRRPLELHHHRPLAIKTSIPKFEESYNPEKHYDPDRERTEAAKLRKEFKREKKGAIRELRKDAGVIAREQLRDKKERDRAYEKKYKRLVAEIQGEEGQQKKAYEREKDWRKKGKK